MLRDVKLLPPHIHGGDIAGAAARYGLDPEDIIDFSANINPLGPPPAVYEAIRANLERIVHYPDSRCCQLTKALSEYLSVSPEMIACGNGASELIFLLLGELSPRTVLLPVPTFSEYEIAARAVGSDVRYLPLDRTKNFTLNISALESSLDGVDLVFLCSPNNPVGNLLMGSDLKEAINICADRGIFTIVDESFLEFVPGWRDLTCLGEVAAGKPLFVLRSLTKFFALPGLRLGCGVGDSQLINAIFRRKDPWSVNLFAQVAGVAALGDEEYREKTRRLIAEEREHLRHQLAVIKGFKPYPSAANFILLQISGTGLTAAKICDDLGRRGLLVRDCSSYPTLGEEFIRVAVRNKCDNARLLQVAREMFE